MSLVDLLINQVLVVIGVLSSAPLARALGLREAWAIAVVGFVVTSVLWTVGASLIYQRLQFFPLLAPVCPHCGKQPTEYGIAGAPHWPRFRLRCGKCEQEIEVITDRALKVVSEGPLPCLQLQWPEFLGRWRRVQ